MRLKIADYVINIAGANYKEFNNLFENYICDDKEITDLQITFSENNNIIIPDKKMAGPYKRWYHLSMPNGDLCTMRKDDCHKIGIVRIDLEADANKAKIEILNCDDISEFKSYYAAFFSIGEAFAYSLLKRKSAVLHSSAIIYNGKAIAFSAKSGTGKSTHTNLWKNIYNDTVIINDDTPVVRFVDNIPYLYGSPFAGTSGINTNISAPLGAVVFLEQANKNSIRKLSGAEAVSKFLEEIKKPIVPDYLKVCLSITEEIIKTTPVYLLSCTATAEAVNLVKTTLKI